MRVTIERDPAYAPCAYLIVQEGASTRDESRTVLVQSDWDFPSLAANLGFVPCSECNSTDGTVDCEHRTAGEMIEAAALYLDTHLGELFEDPGYFGG